MQTLVYDARRARDANTCQCEHTHLRPFACKGALAVYLLPLGNHLQPFVCERMVLVNGASPRLLGSFIAGMCL